MAKAWTAFWVHPDVIRMKSASYNTRLRFLVTSYFWDSQRSIRPPPSSPRSANAQERDAHRPLLIQEASHVERHRWRLMGRVARMLEGSGCFDAWRTGGLWHNMTLRERERGKR